MVATNLAPWPSRRKAKSSSYEVFQAMPVGVSRAANSASETPSTSTHYKRKKARKTVVEGPRRRTRSFKGSDNEEQGSRSEERRVGKEC